MSNQSITPPHHHPTPPHHRLATSSTPPPPPTQSDNRLVITRVWLLVGWGTIVPLMIHNFNLNMRIVENRLDVAMVSRHRVTRLYPVRCCTVVMRRLSLHRRHPSSVATLLLHRRRYQVTVAVTTSPSAVPHHYLTPHSIGRRLVLGDLEHRVHPDVRGVSCGVYEHADRHAGLGLSEPERRGRQDRCHRLD